MKKKLLLFVAIVSVMLFALAFTSLAVEVDGIYYSLSGSGESAYATVSTENRANCKLETVVIPATITVGDTTYKVTSIAQDAFGCVNGTPNQSIKSVTFGAYIDTVGKYAFRRLPYLTSVTINNTEASKGISFNDGEFMDCASLTTVSVHEEGKITTIGAYCFRNCSALTSFDFPKTLTTINNRAFNSCSNLISCDLSKTNVTSIGEFAFASCSKLTTLKLSPVLENLWANCFQSTKITSIVLPETLTTTAKDIFNSTPIVYAVVPAKVSGFTSTLFSNCNSLKVVFYTGSDASVATNQISQIKSFTPVDFEKYDPSIDFASYTTKTIFYNAKTCQKCNGLVGEREFVFTSLAEVMKDQALCTNCGAGDVTTYPAVFTNLGFATFDINHSITQGFVICKASLELYNEKFPEAQVSEYGLVAVAKSRVDSENTAFDSEGNNKTGVTSIEMSSRGYDLIEARITGFDPSQTLDDGTSYADIELYINAYVYVGDTIYYLSNGQSGTTLTGAITYNSVK